MGNFVRNGLVTAVRDARSGQLYVLMYEARAERVPSPGRFGPSGLEAGRIGRSPAVPVRPVPHRDVLVGRRGLSTRRPRRDRSFRPAAKATSWASGGLGLRRFELSRAGRGARPPPALGDRHLGRPTSRAAPHDATVTKRASPVALRQENPIASLTSMRQRCCRGTRARQSPCGEPVVSALARRTRPGPLNLGHPARGAVPPWPPCAGAHIAAGRRSAGGGAGRSRVDPRPAT